MEVTNATLPKSEENEEFWRRHHAFQQSSGLTRKAYCKKYSLNYSCFGYWVHKWNKSNDDKLVSVNIKTTISEVKKDSVFREERMEILLHFP